MRVSSRAPATDPTHRSPPDDLSGHAHRRLIGVFGLLLPFILVWAAFFRPTPLFPTWPPASSISAYYYSGGVVIFTGILVALALLLVTYQGYENDFRKWDRRVGIAAGVAAFCVAFFPTGAPYDLPAPPWWTERMRVYHYVAAGVLFVAFAVFAIVLFPHTDPEKKKTTLSDKLRDPRNKLYYFAGAMILLSIAWAFWAGRRGDPIWLPETIALAFFALSWLVKGRIEWLPSEAKREISAMAPGHSDATESPDLPADLEGTA
jgi:hypothetical protein